MNFLKNTINIIVLYAFIFNPFLNILHIGCVKYLYILLPLRIKFIHTIKLLRKIKREILFFLIIIIYSFIWNILGEGDVYFGRTYLIQFIECIILPCLLVPHLKNKEAIFNYGGYFIILGAVIIIPLILSPNLNLFFRNLTFLPHSKFLSYDFRFFGFAYDLAFSYPLVIGLICSYWILYKNISFLKIAILLSSIFIIAFNARIGFIPICISLFITFTKKIRFSYLIYIGLLIVVIIYWFTKTDFYQQYEVTILWAIDSFLQVSDFIFGTDLALTDTNHLKYLTETHIVYPNNLFEWIYGSGINAFSFSDIGYIIHLHFGGIFLCTLLYVMILCLFNTLFKIVPSLKTYNIVFLTTFFIVNIKGDVYVADVLRFLFFYYINCVFFVKYYISRR